jgi:hypothetical protein
MLVFCLRTLRELKLLRYFAEQNVSENIISIVDIVKPSSYESFTEVYLVQEVRTDYEIFDRNSDGEISDFLSSLL